ncbi:MAG: biotin/lipoyl-binding protein [Nitrospiraceae bacterium]
MQRIREGLKANIRSLVNRHTGLDEIAVDDLATSTKLQSWEAVQIPERLRFSSRLAIKLVALFILIVAFVPWTQTITVTGQLSAYTPFERPQDIEAQITGRIRKWHIFEGVRVKQGDIILELDDYDPNYMAPDLLNLLDQRKQALTDTHKAATSRADQLDRRIKEMQNLVKAAVPSAGARVLEAESKVREAHQKVEAARIAVTTAELNVDRHKQLAEQGLVSQRELELTIQSAIASKADLQGAQANESGRAGHEGLELRPGTGQRRSLAAAAGRRGGERRIDRRGSQGDRPVGRRLLTAFERQPTPAGQPHLCADRRHSRENVASRRGGNRTAG